MPRKRKIGLKGKKIQDCLKHFSKGVNKVLPPKETCETAYERIAKIRPPILKVVYDIQKETKIPQYRCSGTAHFKQIVKEEGTNGKGHTKYQALASGMMEMIERYSCFKYLYHNKQAKIVASANSLKGSVYDIEKLSANMLFPYKTWNLINNKTLKKIKLSWYKAYTLNGESIYLPMTLLYQALVGTNGMAAGNSLEEALVEAICEIVERHCTTLIDFEKIATPTIKLSTIKSKWALKFIKRFTALGHKVWIKDFSLEIGIPVIGVVRKISSKESIVTCGVATDPEEALIRALTENSQSEHLAEEHLTPRNFYNESYCKNSRFRHLFKQPKIMSFNNIPNLSDNNLKVELTYLQEKLEQAGMKIFYLVTTDPRLDIPTVFVYVEGAKFELLNKEAAPILKRNFVRDLIIDLLRSENTRDAERILSKFKSRDKEVNKQHYFFRGVIARIRQRYKQSIQYFNKYLKESHGDKENPAVLFELFYLGLAYQMTGKKDKAKEYYRKVRKLDPFFAPEYAFYNKALHKRVKQLFEAAY